MANDYDKTNLTDITDRFHLNHKGSHVRIYKCKRPTADTFYYLVDDGEHLGTTSRKLETVRVEMRDKGFIQNDYQDASFEQEDERNEIEQQEAEKKKKELLKAKKKEAKDNLKHAEIEESLHYKLYKDLI